MKLIILLSSLLATIVASEKLSLQSRSTNWTVGQTVQTSSGFVNGHAAAAATDVSEYLGIPFAMPPIGDLRFAPPQKYTSTSLVNGTDFGFSCPNTKAGKSSDANLSHITITPYGVYFLAQLSETGFGFSEDCLTLNIWTKPQAGESKKAVMVWIYGGSLTGGSTANSVYNGQYLADTEDVIIVTLNYRLNILGFPGNPAGTNNLGLLDQRMAVEWVRDNIAAFGGDASRITLFGQSAGGTSVDAYSFAYPSDPIVHAFIAESGIAGGVSGNQMTLEEASVAWYNVSTTVGCGGSDSIATDVLACMRTKSYTSLIAAIPPSTSLTGNAGFGLTVDNVIVFKDFISHGSSGNFTKLPILVGNNANEASLFQLGAALAGTPEPQSVWDALELGLSCAIAARVNLSITYDVPSWRYWYFGNFANIAITTSPDSGAYHGAEIAQIWGTTTGHVLKPPTEAETAIAQYMRGAWTTFAKDPVNGLSTYQGGWPVYNPEKTSLIRLGYNNATGTNAVLPLQYDSACNATFPTTGGQNTTSSTSTTVTASALTILLS